MEPLFSNHYANISLHRTTHNTLELQWLDFTPSAAALQALAFSQQYQVLFYTI